jgi:lipopolysaccharide/colanic/teichoic acid biosynthesis glycosyltransferase
MGLIFLSPFFLLVTLLIKHDSPGPVYFRGSRMGKGGKPFNILKFRTMYERPESYAGPSVTAEDDTRITPIGKFLRDSKLNEIPQLWNVLTGQMSLVGPRPEAYEIALEWPAEMRAVITSVRPGITSPASIVYRSEEKLLSEADVLETYFKSILPSKLRLDMLYVRSRSILTDLDVLFWTAVALLPRMREKELRETNLFWGPLSQFVTRFLNWFLLDLGVSVVAVAFGGLLWRLGNPLNLGWQNAVWAAGLIALVFSLLNVVLGVNRITWSRAAAGDVLYLAVSTFFSTAILLLGKNWFVAHEVMPAGFIIISGMLAFMGFVLLRYRERLVTGAASRWIRLRQGAATTGERVLVVGAGDNGELAVWMLHRQNMLNAFSIIGIVDDDPRKQGMSIDGVQVIGTTTELDALVKSKQIDMIVFTICRMPEAERQALLNVCQHSAARVFVMPDLMRECKEGLAPAEDAPPLVEELTGSVQWQSYVNYLTDLANQEDWDRLRETLKELQEGDFAAAQTLVGATAED